jgi:amino acid transporter
MGPLLGTIAGVGTWFSLSSKGALALVGGVPYLLLLLDLPLKPVALALAAILIVITVVGAKHTGRLQVAIVVVMLAALGWFAAGSAPSVQSANYANFFADGIGGLLAATGLVFVSYAGVMKVASVAEEVEDPGRNIPLGILGSLGFTTVLYVAIVAVLVGVTDPRDLYPSGSTITVQSPVIVSLLPSLVTSMPPASSVLGYGISIPSTSKRSLTASTNCARVAP